MKIENLKIDQIKPYPRNPRKNDAAVGKVASSLKEFGWQQPIVVDKDMVVIAGHTRLAAAISLGFEKAPVLIASTLTPSQIKAYRIADNRVAEEADWDSGLLKIELDDLVSNDFSLNVLGFTGDELKIILNPESEFAADEDEVLDVEEDAVSKEGDVWLLGDHKIICGDSTNENTVSKLLEEEKPNLMVTDPPYGVNYDASWRSRVLRSNGKAVGSRAEGKVLNDHEADWTEAYCLFQGDVAYVWCAGLLSHITAESLIKSGFELTAHIIWNKSHSAIGRADYHYKHEVLMYAVRKGKRHNWRGGRKQHSVWDISKPMKSETGHSTQKPVECMKRCIENNSLPEDSIYEPFSGSGTTIIACEILNRRCFAIELNPQYVDLAVRRWQKFTGKKAKLQENNKLFNQLSVGM